MAKLLYNVVLSGVNLGIAANENIELIRPLDNRHDHFEATWTSPNGNTYKGTLPSKALEFTKEEIEEHDLQVDADGLPLFANLMVKYIGSSNTSLNTDDILVIQDPWYNPGQMECQCINTIAKPNIHPQVVVKNIFLRRP